MARRNLTIQLDEETIRKAKVLAARYGASVSGLVAQQIEDLVERDDHYEAAKVKAIALMRAATLRGERRRRREDTYDRSG